MNSDNIQNLQEAYLEVYDELDEGKVELDTKRKNRIRKQATERAIESGWGFDLAKNSTLLKNELRAGAKRKLGQAINMMRVLKTTQGSKTQREQVDIYDIILSHLLDGGYAETTEAAEVIMVNMSEDWRESIMEGYQKLPRRRMQNLANRRAYEAGQSLKYSQSSDPEDQEVYRTATKNLNRASNMIDVLSKHKSKISKSKSKYKK